MKIEDIEVDNLTDKEVKKLASKYYIQCSDYYRDSHIGEDGENEYELLNFSDAQSLFDYINIFASNHNKKLSDIMLGYDEDYRLLYLYYFCPKLMGTIRDEVKSHVAKLVKKKQEKTEKSQKNKLAKFEKLKKELEKI